MLDLTEETFRTHYGHHRLSAPNHSYRYGEQQGSGSNDSTTAECGSEWSGDSPTYPPSSEVLETLWVADEELRSSMISNRLGPTGFVGAMILAKYPWAENLYVPNREWRGDGPIQFRLTEAAPPIPLHKWLQVLAPKTAKKRQFNLPSIYVTDDTVKACLRVFPHLKAHATWQLAWTRSDNTNKAMNGNVIVHTVHSCSGMKNPSIIFIHAKVVRKVNWCQHCASFPGSLFRIFSETAPIPEQQGTNVHPMWHFDKH